MRVPSRATTSTRSWSGWPLRGMAGFTLLDSLLALLISAVLIAPVLGGVFVILKTTPGASSQGAGMSGAQRRSLVLQNLQLNQATSILTGEWRQASIIKLLDTDRPYLNNDLGNECNQGQSSTYFDFPPWSNKPVIALQTIGNADAALNKYAAEVQRSLPKQEYLEQVRGPSLSSPIGLTRVVYNLAGRVSGPSSQRVPVTRPDGTQVFDLVRRECAVSGTSSLPATNLNPDPPNSESCTKQYAIYSDCKGWRLQPGTVDKSHLGPLSMGTSLDWTPVRTVLSNVKSVTKKAVRARQLSVALPTTTVAGSTTCNDGTNGKAKGDPDYDQCDVTLVVTFGDEDTDPSNNRVEKIYLYQGVGS